MVTPQRRKMERHERRLDVLLMLDGEAYQGTTRNLSCAGAFVEVELNIPVIVEPEVGLHFFVPRENGILPVACRGKICWLEGVLPNSTGFGIQFDDLTAKQVSCLRSFFTIDVAEIPSVCRKHRYMVGEALDRWVENGLISKEGAMDYRERFLG